MNLLLSIDIGVLGIVITLLVFVFSIIFTIAWGHCSAFRSRRERICEEELQKTRTDLLHLYEDVFYLLEIEKDYMADSEKSKIEIRKNYSISHRCEPSRIEKRVKELQDQLNM